MIYLHRALEPNLLELCRYFPIVAVLGARQVGKTTLVEKLPLPGLKTVTFDPVQDIGGARADPDLFLQNQPRPLFLDEIQYAPELLSSLKRVVDRERTPGQFLLSGSQNLSVLRGVSESLAGRVALVELLPLSVAELGGKPTQRGFLESTLLEDHRPQPSNDTERAAAPAPPVYSALWRGGFPGILELPDHLLGTYFASYQQTYIERDVRTAADIHSLQTFGRFFGLLAALTACEINHTQLGRELGVDRKTAQAWTDLAAATYQWHEIPAYSRNAIKRIAGKPKGYFTDTGLACHLQRVTSSDHLGQHPLAGRLFETFVVAEIRKRVATWSQKPNLYHFRTYGGAEVDLILELNGVLYPVEIKLSTKPTRRDLRGLDSLRATFPAAEIGPALVVASVPEPFLLREGVRAIPWWRL